MIEQLRDFRIRRLLLANITGSIGSGITIIAIPWLLIKRDHGEQLYGYLTVATTIALFAIVPHYGAWLDRHSRKTAMLAGEIFGATCTLTMAAWMLLTGHTATWQLLCLYFSGMLYYTLHYPAKFAFVQQIFERRHYQRLMSLLEIQGQTASMLSGGLASVLLDHVSFSTILLIDGSTYVISYFIQKTIPYEPTHLRDVKPRVSAAADLMEGLRWLGARPKFTVFICCTFAPFVAVMVGNYLFPIYVQHILHASAAVFGQGEMAFAVGAIVAALVGPTLLARVSSAGTALVMIGVFTGGLALMCGLHTVLSFYCALLLLGVGNAGSRIARGTVLLHEVPNALMGRVNVALVAVDRTLRTILQLAAIAVVVRADAVLAYAGLLLFVGFALVLAFLTRHALHEAAPAPVV